MGPWDFRTRDWKTERSRYNSSLDTMAKILAFKPVQEYGIASGHKNLSNVSTAMEFFQTFEQHCLLSPSWHVKTFLCLSYKSIFGLVFRVYLNNRKWLRTYRALIVTSVTYFYKNFETFKEDLVPWKTLQDFSSIYPRFETSRDSPNPIFNYTSDDLLRNFTLSL